MSYPTHYRYANAHEWLRQAAMGDEDNGITPEVIFDAYLRLASADDIQNEFQADMEADGYFDELLDQPCHVCGEADMTVEDYVTCLDCGRPVHSACTIVVEPDNPHQAVAQHRCHDCDEEKYAEEDDEETA